MKYYLEIEMFLEVPLLPNIKQSLNEQSLSNVLVETTVRTSNKKYWAQQQEKRIWFQRHSTSVPATLVDSKCTLSMHEDWNGNKHIYLIVFFFVNNSFYFLFLLRYV